MALMTEGEAGQSVIVTTDQLKVRCPVDGVPGAMFVYWQFGISIVGAKLVNSEFHLLGGGGLGGDFKLALSQPLLLYTKGGVFLLRNLVDSSTQSTLPSFTFKLNHHQYHANFIGGEEVEHFGRGGGGGGGGVKLLLLPL